MVVLSLDACDDKGVGNPNARHMHTHNAHTHLRASRVGLRVRVTRERAHYVTYAGLRTHDDACKRLTREFIRVLADDHEVYARDDDDSVCLLVTRALFACHVRTSFAASISPYFRLRDTNPYASCLRSQDGAFLREFEAFHGVP